MWITLHREPDTASFAFNFQKIINKLQATASCVHVDIRIFHHKLSGKSGKVSKAAYKFRKQSWNLRTCLLRNLMVKRCSSPQLFLFNYSWRVGYFSSSKYLQDICINEKLLSFFFERKTFARNSKLPIIPRFSRGKARCHLLFAEFFNQNWFSTNVDFYLMNSQSEIYSRKFKKRFFWEAVKSFVFDPI